MILLTGATGHLGANLLRRLLSEGIAVRVLLRHSDNDDSSVEGLDVERIYGDLRDPASLVAATKECSAIYHCAAQVSTVSRGEAEIFACNVLGTRNLLRAALSNGVRRVVVTGSLSATGHLPGRPTDETAPFNPFERHLPYAVSKAAVEHECLKAFADGLDVIVAVSTAILGPNDFKPSRMGQLLIDHARRRPGLYIAGGFEFVAARDIVEGHLLAMSKGRAGQKYIFSTQYMSVAELFDLYREVTGVRTQRLRLPMACAAGAAEVSQFVHRYFLPGHRPLLTPAAVRLLRMRRRVDISKSQRELGYRPGPISDSVREAYDWFVARGLIERPHAIAVSTRASNATKGAGAPVGNS